MKKIHIVHLYPKEMNIYGDTGNRIILEKRLEWRGINYKTSFIGIGDNLPLDADIILGGGGQDAGQAIVEKDTLKKSANLKSMAKDGVVMLMICGMYQLFGEAFLTTEDKTIKGAGILPLFTQASQKRLIGNIVTDTEFGELVGYENHSGRTFLEKGCNPLGKVKKGAGNNAKDRTEGARLNNVFASYLHGPILAKNPNFADTLIKLSVQRYGIDDLPLIDDSLESLAHNIARTRPR